MTAAVSDQERRFWLADGRVSGGLKEGKDEVSLEQRIHSAVLTISPAFLPSGLLSFFHLVGGSIAYTESSERNGRWLVVGEGQ